jgi:beta-lactamase regulating signal transducer with metallopeptidase domain
MSFALALLWKSTLLLAVAFAASRLLARRSAALRHAVWTCAAVALLALPLAQAFAPPLPTPLPQLPHRTAARVVEPPIRAIETHAAPTRIPEGQARVTPVRRALDPLVLAFAFWVGGALVVVAGLVAGRVARARLTRGARPLDDAAWLAQARGLARSLAVRRKVRFLLAANGATPMTWGTFRPTVLLPASALAWPAVQRRAFLVHELGHRRGSIARSRISPSSPARYWMHPGA